MRTVFWEDGCLHLIDQRRLPAHLEILRVETWQETATAISEMAVRGAPAIGVTAAFGLALAAKQSPAKSRPDLKRDMDTAAAGLRAARPTAANLAWAVSRILSKVTDQRPSLDEVREAALREAQAMADEDVLTNRRMAEYGAALINHGDTIIHHCNTGALAAVDWGTALGVIRMAHEQGKNLHVLVDETRPRLQGSRLTAWELQQYGISYEIICDDMAGYFLSRGEAQAVLFGADRVSANGDVANKIGTYMLALAAFDNLVPAYAVVPSSTIDMGARDGSRIPIENRDEAEVLALRYLGEAVAPEGARARNPAFDVTPARLVTAIITEKGIVRPPFGAGLAAVVAG
jgi:methylthioribose-1-phosphate isomerase